MTRPNTLPPRTRRLIALSALAAIGLGIGLNRGAGAADTPGPSGEYLRFVRARAAALRAADAPPKSRADWDARRSVILRHLKAAMSGPPAVDGPPRARTLGVLPRDGYRVEKVVIETMPGVEMTANVYVPAAAGKHPAILAVHGHWRGAKQDPVVQARCIGAAKLGFVVLVVDAFGAGERGVGKALGEYHGEMTAATLFPTGQTLAGVQAFENARAVDYLRTRPDVDPDRIGVTGASGGGNQTMYAAATDDRLKAAVPVCSVGNYLVYLGIASCMCEVVPGALTFTEEWGVLGQVAPRALMVVNATKDAVQFSVPEAKKSIAALEPIYRLHDKPGNLKHAVFESGHDYNRAMREAAYGWFTLHLKGEGDGAPVAEPEVKTEDPEALRCYPGATRPDDFVTLPRYAAKVGRKLVAGREGAVGEVGARSRLVAALGGFPAAPPVAPQVEPAEGEAVRVAFEPEPGLHLSARVEPAEKDDAPRAVLIDLEGAEHAASSPVAAALRKAGWGLVTLDLRATGKLAPPGDKVGKAPDHNSAEWGLWIGRPLLGQWAFDVRRLLDALDKADTDGSRPERVALVGVGPGGLVALAAAAADERVSAVASVGALASFVSDEPYAGQRLGAIVPGILRTHGDVAHLASMIAPRRLVIAGGVSGGGKPLNEDALRAAYEPAARVWKKLGAEDALTVLGGTDAGAVVRALR